MAKKALEKMSTEELQARREALTVERGEAEAKFLEELEPIVQEVSRRSASEALAGSYTPDQLQAALVEAKRRAEEPTVESGGEG